MQLTDHNDIFKKASEEYPLKPPGDRWEEIASKLDGFPSPVKKHARKNHQKWMGMVLLLIAFLFLADFFSRYRPDHNLIRQNEEKELMVSKSDKRANPKTNHPNLDVNRGQDKIEDILKIQLHEATRNNDKQTKRPGPVFSEHPTDIISSMSNDDQFNDIMFFGMENQTLTTERTDIPSVDMQIKKRPDIALNASGPGNTNKVKNSIRGLYVGLTGGVGFTNIKSQEMSRAGADYGLVAGWRFNDRMSVETGLLRSNKNYETAGQYFSLKNMAGAMPADMKLMDVKSTTDLLQIPIHFRYDVFSKSQHRLFASAGFSSYVLFREDNSYHTMHNGTEGMMYSTYKDRRSYIAGSFDFSIGYEKRIGKRTSLRINPYTQLPLKGMGMGELQLKTTGVRLALTRSSN
ncbi:MAG TPA: porin family protein [Chitinophagaceae bacterium]